MTDLCWEATQVTGPVSLFVGIEPATQHWTAQQFTDAGNFAKQHGITCIFLKCFEVGSNAGDIWYGGMAGVDTNINLIKAAGVACIPYGFLYGGNQLPQEIDVCKQLLSKYGVLCLDMEGSPWAAPGAADGAKQIVNALAPIPGELWISCPANPVEAGMLPFLQALVPATNVFMPMVYNDNLSGKWQADFKQVGASCVQPTIDLSGEFGPNNVPAIVAQIVASGAKAFSIWEYQFAKQFAGVFDSAIALITGNQPQGEGTVQLNNQGCVCDIAESYQLEAGESQDLCGPWSVASLKFAGLPGKGATGTAEQIDQGADKEADAWLSGGHTGALGSTIENMHQFLHDAGNLHYWDMATPSIDNIRKAVKAGYPVLITANEQNILEKQSGNRAYPWNLNANHILPITGIDKDGDFISPDPLNNKFQGYWPVTYLANKISPSWATVVQLVGPDAANPWLKSIPGDTPTSWPQGFDAQNFAPAPAPAPQPQTNQAQRTAFETEWKAVLPTVRVDSGIAQAAYKDYQAGNFHGPALSEEFQLTDWNDPMHTFPAQVVAEGIYHWINGQAHYYPYK